MTDILSKHNEIVKRDKEELYRLLKFWKERRESDIILIKKMSEDIDLCDKQLDKVMTDIRKIES